MNEDDKAFLVVRFLAASGGMVGGAMSGTILIILLMVFSGSTLGLTNIWPGTIVGAIIGSVGRTKEGKNIDRSDERHNRRVQQIG